MSDFIDDYLKMYKLCIQNIKLKPLIDELWNIVVGYTTFDENVASKYEKMVNYYSYYSSYSNDIISCQVRIENEEVQLFFECGIKKDFSLFVSHFGLLRLLLFYDTAQIEQDISCVNEFSKTHVTNFIHQFVFDFNVVSDFNRGTFK